MLICSTLHIIDKVVIILTHHYGYLLKVLSGYMKASMDNALASMDLTSAQGHIMGYLAQRSQPPCSRDIEETFHLSHPTVISPDPDSAFTVFYDRIDKTIG